jgi:putative membrane protein
MLEDTDERIILAKERTRLAGERNKLANERTYLAWTRTGLASVGGGFAIIRFLSFVNYSHQVLAEAIGCVLVALGIAIFILSYLDYRDSYVKLKVQINYAGSLWAIGTMTTILILLSLAMLLIAFRVAEMK